jgi:mono/diheme cytochrome c family protein
MQKQRRILAVWAAGTAALMLVFSSAWSATLDGQNLFEKRCIACHKLPDLAQPPPEGWAERLELMAPQARLKPAQKAAVLEYLLSHTKNSVAAAALEEDRVLFEEKCSRCHTLERVFLIPLNDEARQHVVHRMQARSGTGWLSDEEVERILAYLALAGDEVTVAQAVGLDAGGKELFFTRCSACHTVERVFLQLGDSAQDNPPWAHTVSRMRSKAPQWMTDEEATQILEYLQSLNVPGE